MIIQVFDPPMCCSSGVCGPSVDPQLVQFAADLDWLRSSGVEIVRYNLSQQPAAFVGTPAVKAALARSGNACLPLTLVDGAVKCEGRYPTRDMLAAFVGLGPAEGRLTNAVSSCCCSPAPVVTFVGRKPKGSSCC